MHFRSLVIGAAALASVLAVVPAGAASPLARPTLEAPADAAPAAQQRTTVTIGFVGFTALSWPFYVAEALGSFEQEGLAPDVEMASFALIEARGAGRMAFGGFFPRGETLALMRSEEAEPTLDALRATGFWKDGSLRARPLLYVL